MAITNLTGTEWELKANPTLSTNTLTWALEVEFQNDLGLAQKPTSNSFTVSQAQVAFENSGQAVVSYTAQDGWSWVVAQSTEAPLIKITGGQDTTTQATIDWITANATQVVDPTVEPTPVMTKGVFAYFWSKLKTYLQNLIPGKATDSDLGTIRLNTAIGIDADADGRLLIKGLWGEFPNSTGIYSPNNREPVNVNNYSMLLTDAKGMNMSANRSLAIVSGYGITCKSAPAGSTEYRVSNNYTNRIKCKMLEGGYLSLNEAISTQQPIIPVVSVTIDGAAFTPDSAADNSSKDIVIKVESTVNPDAATTGIRGFGTMGSYATAHIGNGVKSVGGGRNLLIGGAITKYGSSNDNCLVGDSIYSSGNGNACFGRWHVAIKNRGLLAGTGHDTTNAPAEGASAVGMYSYMDASTLFAVGNGTGHTARSNAFEVRQDGIVLKSPNGTRYKISVANDGTISSTPV